MLPARARASSWFIGAIERAVRGLVAEGESSAARALVQRATLADTSERLVRLEREVAAT